MIHHPIFKVIATSVLFFLIACGAEEDSSDDSASGGDAPPSALSGLWVGTTEETIGTATTATTGNTHVLFQDTKVFVLKEDEALVGDYTQNGFGSVLFNVSAFVYANPDTTNLFFVGSSGGTALDISALFATDSNMVGSYSNTQRAGFIDVSLDTGYQSIEVSHLYGTWDTTNSETFINAQGQFLGYNSSTSCRWQGQLSSSSLSTILSITITRDNCDEFNGSSTGIAFVDGEGDLHFISETTNQVLWMRFSPVASTANTDSTDTTTDTTTIQ